MRKLFLGVVAALVGAGVLAAVSLGGEGQTRPAGFDRDFERVPAHPTDDPVARSAAPAHASAKGKPKVKYFETAPVPVPVPGTDVATACPSKHKALSGYYLTTGAIVPDVSAIAENSPRVWGFGFVNLTGESGEAIIGVVCGKKL